MADFHIDNDIPPALAQELMSLGHTAVTARDLGLSAAGDEVHLFTAAQSSRILVTHNKDDFVLLHAAWIYWTGQWQMARAHQGILIVKQQKLLVPQMARAIDGFTKRGQPLANRAYEWTISDRLVAL